MATYNKFDQFAEDLVKKVHNLDADTFKVMLTNTAPVRTNSVFADLVEITAANGYTAGGDVAASPDAEQTTGTVKFVLSDITWTASGGSIGPFRYAVLYNDTPTSPADPLVAWWDYGVPITVINGQTFKWDADGAAGIFTFV